jgi:hypothetical protein
LDLHNIESIFAAFEMARTLGGFADYGPDVTDSLVRAMRTLIVKTLEQTILLPVRNNSQVLPPPPYTEFAALCSSLRNARPAESIAVITFNTTWASITASTGIKCHSTMG